MELGVYPHVGEGDREREEAMVVHGLLVVSLFSFISCFSSKELRIVCMVAPWNSFSCCIRLVRLVVADKPKPMGEV